MQTRFQKGEYIRYGSSGVCLIDDVRTLDEKKSDELFYILRPIADRHSTFFIPVGNEAPSGKIRALLRKEEIDALIDSVHADNTMWIEDRKERMEHFRNLLRECDAREILKLAAVLYNRKNELASIGKKLSPSDLSVLKQAEDLTDNEFAFVLHLEKNEVGRYIRRRLNME